MRIGPKPLGDAPGVVLFFGGAAAATDDVTRDAAREAMRTGRAVIPVTSRPAEFANETPEFLHQFNAYFWDPEGVRGLSRFLLEELGIEEGQRRVFISHRREDGLLMAEQLHDELSHHRFRPFIDRFAIPPGAEVQEGIAEALEEFSFLLLIESPLASDSPWVFYEVEYALSHFMSLCIISWPAAPELPGTPGLPRVRLTDDELVEDHNYNVLSPEALARVVAAVEEAHARGLVRRRQNLLVSVQDALTGAGKAYTPLTGWRLLMNDDHGLVVGVAPRLPEVNDLHELDKAAARALGAARSSVLVHASRRLPMQRQELLSWASGDRTIALVPENAVGRYW